MLHGIRHSRAASATVAAPIGALCALIAATLMAFGWPLGLLTGEVIGGLVFLGLAGPTFD